MVPPNVQAGVFETMVYAPSGFTVTVTEGVDIDVDPVAFTACIDSSPTAASKRIAATVLMKYRDKKNCFILLNVPFH